jgi:hypothetical protein
MNSRQRRTLEAVFAHPTRSDVEWSDVESLLGALGADIKSGRGSAVRVRLNGVRAILHRPHPRKEMIKGSVEALQDLLTAAGVDS